MREISTRALAILGALVLALASQLVAFGDLVPWEPGGSEVTPPRASLWGCVGEVSTTVKSRCEAYRPPPGTLCLCFEDQSLLGAHVYGLALHARDIGPSVDISAFRRGVSGCHYSAVQVAAWANYAILTEGSDKNPLLNVLLDRGFLRRESRWVWPTREFKHLVLVTEGKKRSIEQNILHEFLHVRYDLDPVFREGVRKAWDYLPEKARKAFLESRKSYDTSQTEQMIEEWGVRMAEKGIQANEPTGTEVDVMNMKVKFLALGQATAP